MLPRPWSVQLEVTEGCNLRCWFCGIHAIRSNKRDWKYMSVDLVRQAFEEINDWCKKTRVELNNHGEPTTNPKFFEIVSAIKEACPKAQVQLQTNGHAVFPQYDKQNDFDRFVKRYFDAGGNLLVLNCYVKGFYEYAMERCAKLQNFLNFTLVDFYFDNPENLSAYRYYNKNARMVFVFQDLGLANVEGLNKKRAAKNILNEAGNSPADALEKNLGIKPITQPLDKCCSRVFRELTIGWNGVIPACCYDWKNDLVFGKFPETSLQDIWEGDYWQAARVLLHPDNCERHMTPCDRCNYNGGFRTGLLWYPGDVMDVPEAYSVLSESYAEFEQFRYA